MTPLDERAISPVPDRRRLAARLATRGIVGLALIDACLFGVAGRTDWPSAWIFTALFGVYLVIGATWFVRRNPDLRQERMKPAGEVPRWDRVLIAIYRVLFPVMLATAALDVGNLRWSRIPVVVEVLGVVLIVSAFAVTSWCTATNHFLSSKVRLQTDRGHTVVQDGPYRYVRHPMYTSLIVLMSGSCLLLGSWLALIPAALIAAIFVTRTVLEDRFLTENLDGYRLYASRVQSRLVPGIW